MIINYMCRVTRKRFVGVHAPDSLACVYVDLYFNFGLRIFGNFSNSANFQKKNTSGKFSSKDWRKTIKTFLCKDKIEDIPPLIQNRHPKNDPNDKANVFNQYF